MENDLTRKGMGVASAVCCTISHHNNMVGEMSDLSVTFWMGHNQTLRPLEGLSVSSLRRLNGGAWKGAGGWVEELGCGLYRYHRTPDEIRESKLEYMFSYPNAQSAIIDMTGCQKKEK